MSRALFGFILFVTTSSVISAAQGEPGTLAGAVRDSSGAAIPGATVQIVAEATNATLEAVADGQGTFRISPLSPGAIASRPRSTVRSGGSPDHSLDGRGSAALSLTLSPSRLSESVVVTARRVEEVAQEVPIPVSVVSGALAAETARSTSIV